MIEPAGSVEGLRRQLSLLLERGAPLERQGFPLGSLGLRSRFEEEARTASTASAEEVVARARSLVELGEARWPELEVLLEELEHLRDLGALAGMDLARVDAKAGNPRELLLLRGPSAASLDAAGLAAKLALATLREALPRFCVDQARALGGWARRARARGENVTEAIDAVSRVAHALNGSDLDAAARAVADARAAMNRSSAPAPTSPGAGPDQEEILREAHFLARRLPGTDSASELPGVSRGIPSSALSGTEVLSTPEEEIATLWAEVDRIVRERDVAAARSLYPSGPPQPEPPLVVEVAGPAAEPPPASTFAPEVEVVAPSVTEASEETPEVLEGAAPAHAEPAREEPASAAAPPPVLEVSRPLATPPLVAEPLREPTAPAAPPPSGAGSAPSVTSTQSARISFSAAYVPPLHASSVGHRASRAERARPRRSRSRHKT